MKSIEDLRDIGTNRSARVIPQMAYCLLREKTISQAARCAEIQGFRQAAEVLKAVVGAGTLNDPGWASNIADAGAAQAAFLALLRSQGAFDGMLSDTIRLPLDIAGLRVETSVTTGSTPGEGAALSVSRFDFDSPIGSRLWTAAVCVLSRTVLDLAPDKAVTLIETELRRACIAGVDNQFVAILQAGALSITSSGSSAAAVRADLREASDSMELGDSSRLYVLVPANTARHLAFMTDTAGAKAFGEMTVRDGSIDGIRVIPTDALVNVGSPAFASPLLVDASRIATWSEGVGLDRAEHAALEMRDDPVARASGVGSPDTPVAAQLVSLWQTNSVGLRASRWWAARKASASCVCQISGAAW